MYMDLAPVLKRERLEKLRGDCSEQECACPLGSSMRTDPFLEMVIESKDKVFLDGAQEGNKSQRMGQLFVTHL